MMIWWQLILDEIVLVAVLISGISYYNRRSVFNVQRLIAGEVKEYLAIILEISVGSATPACRVCGRLTVVKVTPSSLVKTALRAVQGLSDPDTHRNPKLWSLLFGGLLSRVATRRGLAMSSQPPPRNTRYEPVSGPGGLVAGELA